MRRSQLPAVVVGLAAALTFPVIAGESDDHGVHSDPKGAGHSSPQPAAPKPSKPAATGAGHDDSHGKPSTTTMEPKPAAKPAAATPSSATKPAKQSGGEPAAVINADEALKMLVEGNVRWAADQDRNPNTDPSRRAKLAEDGQKPFATILTCADSRIPVERVFDRGVGDLFVIRVAGNVAGGSETGTIEYGVGHLNTPVLIVMGHTKCGAVAAAATGAEVHGKVAELVGNIMPAVERAKRNNPDMPAAELTPIAVRENVWQSVFDLFRNSQELRTRVSANQLRVVGAVYDIATGKVEFLGDHPWQSELIEAMNARAAHRATGSTASAGTESEH